MKCRVEGCDREHRYLAAQLCQKHYFRVMRNGTTEKLPPKAPKLETPNGYLTCYSKDHPLGRGRSRVYEHRIVAYEKYGEGPFKCALCTRNIDWSNLHVDHIDENRKNNIASNLRLTCRGCNVKRTVKKSIPLYEFEGEKLTLTQISKIEGVTVCREQLYLRLKKGMDLKDAMFSKNVTHFNGVKNERTSNRKASPAHHGSADRPQSRVD